VWIEREHARHEVGFAREPDRLRKLTEQWQAWGDKVGVTPWKDLPGANYKPTPDYRKKSEPVAD
jgi:hypothetical protein